MNYLQTPVITFHAAHDIVRIAIEQAEARGVRAVATIVDPSLLQVAMGKADGATPHSVETSRRKAATAASTRKPTGWMTKEFAVEVAIATNTPIVDCRPEKRPAGFNATYYTCENRHFNDGQCDYYFKYSFANCK